MSNNINGDMNITSDISKFQQTSILSQLTDKTLYMELEQNFDANSAIYKNQEYLFYNFPKYYDLAFNRDVKSDIEFYQRCFQQYPDVEVNRVLEPACGTGFFLEVLPRYGYYTMGYDLNQLMVDYSKERLRKAGWTIKEADVIVGNMKDLVFDKKLDAAFICINSLGYLRSDEDISSHFKAMGQSLKKGGIYIVELSCMCDDIKNEKKLDDKWCIKEDGIEIELTWEIKWYDVQNRIRHVDFHMVVNDNGREMVVEEAHNLRIWLIDEFKNFTKSGGFDLIGIYNQLYEKISENDKITGELGILFFVLKNNE